MHDRFFEYSHCPRRAPDPARDMMRRDKRLNCDLDRLPMLTFMHVHVDAVSIFARWKSAFGENDVAA